MPKLTTANCPALAAAKRLYNKQTYARCLAIVNGPGGTVELKAYLAGRKRPDERSPEEQSALAAFPHHAAAYYLAKWSERRPLADL